MMRIDPSLRDAACIDLRSPDAHAVDRPANAVRLDIEDLLQRPYLLPPRSRALVLIGGPRERLPLVIEALRAAGHPDVRHLPDEGWRQQLPVETGPPTRMRLWEPSGALVEALESFGSAFRSPHSKSPESAPWRPTALDLACGSGRNAVYLALQGFEVTAVDRLPDALEKAQDLAARNGVEVHALRLDLEFPGALDDLHADLIVVVRYLERTLFGPITRALRPGGLLVYETFTVEQASLGHPRNPRFLLQPDELHRAFPDLEVLSYREGFFDHAHLACLLARQPSGV